MNSINWNGSRENQSGAALMVVLVILVIITLLGLAALRGTLMQERMAGNQYDRSLSFQAAENALKAGERSVEAAACDVAACPLRDGAWLDAATWTDDSISTAASLGGLAPAGRYMRERMGTNASGKPVYRVTARAQAAGRAEVIVQSLFEGP